MVDLATKMDMFSIVYVAEPEEAVKMADVGADAIISHVGTTVGGSIGVTGATRSMDFAVEKTQEIIEAVRKSNPDTFFLAHGGPVNTPDDVRMILDKTDAHGFVGASSLERMGVEQSLTDLTRQFKSITLKK
jgi:predicted TIM-barrel enzyme